MGADRVRSLSTGQAILSRFPITDASALRFDAQSRWRWSINPVQPRRGGRIALRAQTGGLLVYNAHLESGSNEPLKARQIAEILADERREAVPGMPVVVAGDFNNGPLPGGRMFQDFCAAAFLDALLATGDRGRTSAGQQHPIDWIFVKGLTSSDGRVVATPAAASRPLPALATLQPADHYRAEAIDSTGTAAWPRVRATLIGVRSIPRRQGAGRTPTRSHAIGVTHLRSDRIGRRGPIGAGQPCSPACRRHSTRSGCRARPARGPRPLSVDPSPHFVDEDRRVPAPRVQFRQVICDDDVVDISPGPFPMRLRACAG